MALVDFVGIVVDPGCSSSLAFLGSRLLCTPTPACYRDCVRRIAVRGDMYYTLLSEVVVSAE